MSDRYQGTAFAEIAATLESRGDLPELAPRRDYDAALTRQLLDTSTAELFGDKTIVDGSFAKATVSAFLLWNDALDESHTLSQDLPSSTGSYLHGIMHRREPDYGNSKYWFRNVGSHPLFEEVGHAASAYISLEDLTNWDPYTFIDRCEASARGRLKDEQTRDLKGLQLDEMRLITAYCFQHAVGA